MKLLPILVLMAVTAVTGNAAAGPDSAVESSWFVDMNRFAQSAHAALACQECHGSMQAEGRPHPDPQSSTFLKASATQAYDYSRCAKCHSLSYQRYLDGAHAKALVREESGTTAVPGKPKMAGIPAPTCGHCHNSHYARSGLSRLTVGRAMVETCGRCHPDHAASYLDNIHGRLGVDLENPAAAYCSDCHGAHTVEGLKTPEKTLMVCQRCHPKASGDFANIVVHASLAGPLAADSPKSDEFTWIQRVRMVAMAVVALTLILFVAHSCLWLLREIHEKLRKP